MSNEKLYVYNQAQGSLLSSQVTVVDTTTEHLKTLIEYLAGHAGTGLWLKPYRGIPEARGLPQVDLVYLDQNNRVIQEIESHPSPTITPMKSHVASALVFQTRTISNSHTRIGDQLTICTSGEAEGRPEILKLQAAWDAAAQAAEAAEDHSRQLKLAIQELKSGKSGSAGQNNDSLIARFVRWINYDRDPSERRKAKRHSLPGLVAFFWTGGAPKAYFIGDISESGVYVLTDERQLTGTIIQMTLQRTDRSGEDPGDSIAVRTKVVRWGDDGLGFAFLLPKQSDLKKGESRSEIGADEEALKAFLQHLNLPKQGNQQKICA